LPPFGLRHTAIGLSAGANDCGRYASGNHASGYIAAQHGTGGNYGSLTNMYAFQHNRARTNPRAIFDGNRAAGNTVVRDDAIAFVNGVSGRKDFGVGTYQYFCTNVQATFTREVAADVDYGARANV